ncbi:hypothetical protein AAT19DRAFT_16174 [Rhodotorula toruloides]|uniref:Uncharacterized protein n=1 Tax=Rhodotorula toruloides TaxID=5286 RepID=A0A2T0A5X5_RHOTO|nr:hypothetical protein AAT19DRAFT_16174 [Rhodotorula toruloides]
MPDASQVVQHAAAATATSMPYLPLIPSHLPVELVAASLKQPTKSHSHAHHHHEHRPRCTLDSEDEKFDSIFVNLRCPLHLRRVADLLHQQSFPRNYTTHVRCPKHGIVHDPALALPERNSRETSSFESSCSSIKSTRSLKVCLRGSKVVKSQRLTRC